MMYEQVQARLYDGGFWQSVDTKRSTTKDWFDSRTPTDRRHEYVVRFEYV